MALAPLVNIRVPNTSFRELDFWVLSPKELSLQFS